MNSKAESKFMRNFQKIEDENEIKKLLDRVLFKTFFHSLEWHEFLEKEFKWINFEYYLYKNELLFEIARIGTKIISLPFCEYGGPLPLKENIDFKNFEKDVLVEFGENIKIKFHPFIKAGNQDSLVATHWIEGLDKKSEQEIFNSFRKTLRHSIRHAQERGIKIKRCENLEELKKFYNLYAVNLKRKRTIPYPYSIFEYLYKQPETDILLAVYSVKGVSASDGKIIAGDLFLHYSDFIHYFFSASDYKYRKLEPSYLILWEKIKNSLGKEFKIFDLGAAPKNSDLEIFKLGWRGKEYPILQLGIQRQEESLRSSKLIRFIWGLLPNFAVRKLSSALIKYRL